RMVCAMRSEHPLATGTMTLKRFLDAGHLRVAMSPTDHRFVDSKLAAEGLSRKISVNVPQWLLVPEMLRETDLLGVISERIGNKLTGQGIVCTPLPFEVPEFQWMIYSQNRHVHSHAHGWMSRLLHDVAEGLPKNTSAHASQH
ncbi:LysR substrate-binding domain-containing protein, partial [Pseudomonas aeruginosa]|uniref:LysR substrate-binding domain-containing protein n=1 Tax=Pseudomonas aeruginosa TaxID=287 RepID=UPI0021C48D90